MRNDILMRMLSQKRDCAIAAKWRACEGISCVNRSSYLGFILLLLLFPVLCAAVLLWFLHSLYRMVVQFCCVIFEKSQIRKIEQKTYQITLIATSFVLVGSVSGAATQQTIFSLKPDSITSTNDPVDLFERFMEYPPIIKSIVFSISYEMDKGQADYVKYYEGRWQSNAFLLRRLQKPTRRDQLNTVPLEPCLGRINNVFWQFGPLNKFWVWTNLPSAGKDGIGLEANNRSIENDLARIMNLGIADLDIRSIHWTNHEFQSISSYTKTEVRGKIVETKENKPYRLETKYSREAKVNQFQIIYDYDSRLLNGKIPKFITCEHKKIGNYESYFKIEIHSLETSNEPNLSGHFGPEQFQRSDIDTIYGVDGKLFLKHDTNDLVLLHGNFLKPKNQDSSSTAQVTFYSVLLIANSLGFFVAKSRLKR